MSAAGPGRGATVAASVVSTTPAARATKNAYACSQPRILGLPRSTGRRRVGADLARVAEHWGVSTDEVVERHTGTGFQVAFCGFAPGFGYLAGLPAALAVPRLDTPRPRVPAGSVALAGRYCGVYPGASPGG